MTHALILLKAVTVSRKDGRYNLHAYSGRILFNCVATLSLAFSLVASTVEARLSSHQAAPSKTFQARPFYEALAAEIYNQMGDEKLAVDHYMRLISFSDDPSIAKRVTELATVTGQLKKALNTSKRWVVLAPDNLEANQYLALLQLRNSQFEAAAKQLNNIYLLVEKSSDFSAIQAQHADNSKKLIATHESLKFIGSLLAAESHHDKAYQVFGLYLEKYANNKYQSQQKLISADLAMKAKKYTDVVSALEFLDELDTQNLVDASAMKARALQRLNHTSEAIQVLDSIKGYKETSDSSRLELVRLLVLDKQKKKALPILEKLIKKHQKNNDLLKSLIALQIDQSFLKKADDNIQKLHLIEKYRDDAEYFTGEIQEKRGRLKKALASYTNVKAGAFLKNAHKKAIHLTSKVKGSAELEEFFKLKQKNATKAKDKAYWVKLQADYLFDAKIYSQALVLYNNAITLTPGNTLYHYHRGLVHERMGKLELAENDFNFVINKRKNHADALNALGYMLSVNTQRLSEARNYIKKAYEIKPNDPVIMDSLGYVLFKTGDLSAAERYLRKAFRLIQNPEVASHLIAVLAELNQHQEARRIFDEMNKKYPDNNILNNLKQKLMGI